MEKIIETRYLNIEEFRGIAFSDRAIAVLMVDMLLKKHPLNFNFGIRKKSHGAKLGEYGG